MLSYYRPGLDVSKLSDAEFVIQMGHLLKIREMEQKDQVTSTIKNLFGE